MRLDEALARAGTCRRVGASSAHEVRVQRAQRARLERLHAAVEVTRHELAAEDEEQAAEHVESESFHARCYGSRASHLPAGTAAAIGTATAPGTALPRRELAALPGPMALPNQVGTARSSGTARAARHCPDGGHCNVAHAGTSRREYSSDAVSFGAGKRDALLVAPAGTSRRVAPSSASRRETVAPVPPTRRASLGPGRHDASPRAAQRDARNPKRTRSFCPPSLDTSLAAGRRDAAAGATAVNGRSGRPARPGAAPLCPNASAKATRTRTTELLCPDSTGIPRTPRVLLATDLPAERSRWKSSKRSFPTTLQRVPAHRPPAAGNRFAPRPAGTLGALPSAPGSELPPRGSVRRRRRKGAGEAASCLRGALARSVSRSGAPSPGSARKGAWCGAETSCAPGGTLQVATCLGRWCKLSSDGAYSGPGHQGGRRREAEAHRQCACRARGGRSLVGARAVVCVRAGAPAEGAARRVSTGGGKPMGGGAHRSVLPRLVGGIDGHARKAGSAGVALVGDAAVPRRGHGARGRDAGARNLPDAVVSDRRARGTERGGLRAGREDESHRAGAPNASPLVGVFSGVQPVESACRADRSAGGPRQYKDRWPRKHRLRGHCEASPRGEECGAAVESERNQRLALGWGQQRSEAASFGVEPSERVLLSSASAAGLVCVRSMRASEGNVCPR